jgi:hypothetical protein
MTKVREGYGLRNHVRLGRRALGNIGTYAYQPSTALLVHMDSRAERSGLIANFHCKVLRIVCVVSQSKKTVWQLDLLQANTALQTWTTGRLPCLVLDCWKIE